MKATRKICLILATIFVVCALSVTALAEEIEYDDAVNMMNVLGFKLPGYDELPADGKVEKYQAALLIAEAMTGKTDLTLWNVVPKSTVFTDVEKYGSAIDYLCTKGIMRGSDADTFGYSDGITYMELISAAVGALGYIEDGFIYPYDHILAAEKLGLTEDISATNYTKELTFGETLQILWSMLNTEIAVFDPLSGELLYPGEMGMTGALIDGHIVRTTLLVEYGLDFGVLDAVIVDFCEADQDDERSVDIVTIEYTCDLDYEYWGYVDICASALGITADTPKVSYLGLPVTLYVDCSPEDFEWMYADGYATVVHHDFAEYTTVENVGEDENIRFYLDTEELALGDDVFRLYEYEVAFKVFSENGWRRVSDDDALYLLANFAYEPGYGYVWDDAYANTYGKIEYRVVEDTDDDNKDEVEVLYTPYTFGQYVERELTYAVTAKPTKFVLYGQFGASKMDGEDTKITEKFFGSNTTLTSTTASVRKNAGQYAVDLTVEGVEVKSGDFMFFNYNEVDNVLTVAANCGTLATGRMTATSATKETVKINGVNYEFGFNGLYPAPTVYDNEFIKNCIANLEVGKDNVQYLAVDNRIVFLAPYAEAEKVEETAFVILNTDAELIADLLGITDKKYADALIGGWDGEYDEYGYVISTYGFDGVYVKDGKVVVAVLNTASGEWELGYIAGVALNYAADADGDYDFTTTVDVATTAGHYEIAGDNIKRAADYKAACALIKSGLAMVVEEEDGVYTIADIDTKEDYDYLVDRYTESKGLTFSASGISNKIKASADEDARSVATNENTVLVLFNTVTGEYGIRKGAQNAETKVAGSVTFFTADASLIVMATTTVDATAWGDISIGNDNINYYLKTAWFEYEIESTDNEDEYSLIVTGLYDIRNFRMADEIVVVGTKDDITYLAKTLSNLTNTQKIYLNKKGELTTDKKNASFSEVLVDLLGTDYTALAGTSAGNYNNGIVVFDDANTIKLSNNPAKAAEANIDLTSDTVVSNIEITVGTADLTDIDWDNINFDSMYVDMALYEGYTEYDGVKVGTLPDGNGELYYLYKLDVPDEAVEINAPEAGVLDQFVLDMTGKTVKVLDEEGNCYAFTVNCRSVATYDEDTDTVKVVVLKYIVATEADGYNSSIVPVIPAPETPDPDTPESETQKYDYVIINTESEIIADLLGITEVEYADSLIGAYGTYDEYYGYTYGFDGVYVKDGKVVVAALDVTTGEWELVNIAGVALDYCVDEDGEYAFATTVDIATLAGYYEIAGDSIKKADEYKQACSLIKSGFVMVVEENDGTYTIADIDTMEDYDYLVDRYTESKGLIFSASGISNKIKASADDDAASIATNENTLLVLFNIATGEYGIRVGAQNAETKVAGSVDFFAASDNLIVMATTTVDARAWGDIWVGDEDTNYFLKTAAFDYEFEVNENDEYSLNVTGLYDIRNFRMADEIVVVGTKDDITYLANDLDALSFTQKIYLNKKGELTTERKSASFGAVLVDLLGTDYTALGGTAAGNYNNGIVVFEDANTIKLSNNPETASEANVDLTADTVVSNIEITVATANLTDINFEHLKDKTLFVSEPLGEYYTEYDGVTVDCFCEYSDELYYEYKIEVPDEAVVINAPTAGILDQFAIDMMGKTIRVLTEDGDEFEFTVYSRSVATYDEKTDTVKVVVFKYIMGSGWCGLSEWNKYNSTHHRRVCSCGYVETSAHVYGEWSETVAPTTTADGEKVRECVDCGYKQTVAIPALTTAVISASSATVISGESVAIDLFIRNDVGFGGVEFTLDFNTELLTLESVTFADGFGGFTATGADVANADGKIVFCYAGTQNSYASGKFATLVFGTSAEVDEATAVLGFDTVDGTSFYYDGKTEKNLALAFEFGVVNILKYKPGDVNRDGDINIRDAAMVMQYIARWDVEIHFVAADVNCDGVINVRDAAMIMQYLANWDVVLGRKVAETSGVSLFAVRRTPSVALSLSSVKCLAGDTVSVDVIIDSNDGMGGIDFDVVFNPLLLTLVEVNSEGEVLPFVKTGVEAANTSGKMSFCYASTQNTEACGKVATLVFKVSDSAQASELPLVIEYGNDAFYYAGSSMLDLDVVASNGSITVEEPPRLAGDINGNGEVDLYDVLAVIQAAANKTMLEGADMNGDGKISLVDILQLLKLITQ